MRNTQKVNEMNTTYILLLITLSVCLYYQSGFELTVSRILWRLRCIIRYGTHGMRIVYSGAIFKPFTGCITCTTFWTLVATYCLIWAMTGINHYYAFLVIALTLMADSFRRIIYIIIELINRLINRIDERTI